MQTKRWSIIETITSTVVGFIISYLLNMLIVPWLFDVHPSAGQNITMVAIFTIASLIRGYGLRRLFNRIHMKLNQK